MKPFAYQRQDCSSHRYQTAMRRLVRKALRRTLKVQDRKEQADV